MFSLQFPCFNSSKLQALDSPVSIKFSGRAENRVQSVSLRAEAKRVGTEDGLVRQGQFYGPGGTRARVRLRTG